MVYDGGGEISVGLECFLSRFKISGGKSPTHTRFGDSYGSYYIPVSDNDRFFRVYSRYVAKTYIAACSHICLVERHRDHGPIVIDLDFRYKPSENDLGGKPKRRYTVAEMQRFMNLYLDVANEWINLPDNNRVFLQEKSEPKIDCDVLKDGVHIVLPDAVVDTRVQLLIRQDVVNRMDTLSVIDSCGSRPSDMFDESVIRRNGWMVYGSGKTGDHRYEVTHLATVSTPDNRYGVSFKQYSPPRAEEEILEHVKLFSVRNKEPTSYVRPEKAGELNRVIESEEITRKLKRDKRFFQDAPSHQNTGSRDEYDMASQLCRLLGDERAESYGTWMEVGWCLRNIDHRLMYEWIEFSKKSSKFIPGVCEDAWDHMKIMENGYGMGSLRKWARDDDPSGYSEILNKSVSGRVRAAANGLHYDVAQVVKALFGDRYVCASVRNNHWYRFANHKWEACDSGYHLRSLLSVDVYNRFIDEARISGDMAQNISVQQKENDAELGARHTQLATVYKQLNDVANKLKTGAFKDAVMRECKELMYKPNFESQLDTKPHLVGFSNGVFDLDANEFRAGIPEDMISFSTKYDYVAYDEASPVIGSIMRYFEQTQPMPEVREYLLRLMGSYLHGSVREERFHVWTGSGANGKSITINLIERTLGDYFCVLPIALLTQKRAASNAATSEVANLKGRRFAVLQEPTGKETLNVGLMKELTGGDKIMARKLYHEPIEFRSYARLALTCNILPNVPSNDGGTWRRIRLIPFVSKFDYEEKDPNNPYHFRADNTIADRLDEWAPHMMAILIRYYYVYHSRGNKEPQKVLEATQQYQQSQDAIKMFIDNCLVLDKDGEILVADLHLMFKDYLVTMDIKNTVKRMDLIKDVERQTKLNVVGSGEDERFLGLARKPKKEAACQILDDS